MLMNQKDVEWAIEILEEEIKSKELYKMYLQDNGESTDYTELLLETFDIAKACMELQVGKKPNRDFADDV